MYYDRDFPLVASEVPEADALDAAKAANAYCLDFPGYEAREAYVAALIAAYPAVFAKFEFSDGQAAYGAAQSCDYIKNGAMLIVPRKKALALAWAWPVAVSAKGGGFHQFKAPSVFREFASRAQLEAAIAEVKARGWEVAEGLEEYVADWAADDEVSEEPGPGYRYRDFPGQGEG